jgi:hypothetical protein
MKCALRLLPFIAVRSFLLGISASFVNAVPEKTVGAQRSKLSFTREGLSKIARVPAHWRFAPRFLFRLAPTRIRVVFLHGFAERFCFLA